MATQCAPSHWNLDFGIYLDFGFGFWSFALSFCHSQTKHRVHPRDDLGYGDIGAFGQRKIRTPNLDRMAAEECASRSTTRQCRLCAVALLFLTGKHPGHAWIRNNQEVKPEGQVPLAQTLSRSRNC